MSKRHTERKEKHDEAIRRSAEPKRPYQPPVLRCLGSVAELTLGSTSGEDEGGGGTFIKGG